MGPPGLPSGLRVPDGPQEERGRETRTCSTSRLGEQEKLREPSVVWSYFLSTGVSASRDRHSGPRRSKDDTPDPFSEVERLDSREMDLSPRYYKGTVPKILLNYFTTCV